MRLLIVSNRLPITIVEKKGELRFHESAGGLVSGLSAYLSMKTSAFTGEEHVWVGWSGIAVEDEQAKEELKSKALAEYHCHPIFLSEKVMDKFYNGFCNKIIWPLFHYFPSYRIQKK